MHELGHVFGFWHEHTRADRDQYIEVLYENVKAGSEHNFKILPENEWDNLSTPYDFGSIMHYRLDDFSVNGRNTMRIRDGIEFPEEEVGQRVGPSEVDFRQINLLYRCPYLDYRNRTNGKVYVAGSRF